ncbi:MAG: hypothetical protein WCV88_02645 [Patescibacteria group bacterium]|jgi:hypothetical protein
MKKITKMLFVVSSLFAVTSWFMPMSAYAFVPSNLEGRYNGDWELLDGGLCYTAGATGNIVIRIVDMDANGTINDARVKFSDEAQTPAELGTGRIFMRNGVRRIRLNYDIAGYDRYIKGRLTRTRKIKGNYYHAASDDSCIWSGSVSASHI